MTTETVATISVSGAGSSVTLDGTSDIVDVTGTNDTFTGEQSGNTISVSGTDQSIYRLTER